MTENAQEALSGYIDAVKWIVGISGAAIAGVFLHPEAATRLSDEAKYCLAAVMLLFGISSFGGVVYILWLNSVRRKKEKIEEIEAKLAAPVAFPNPDAADLEKERSKLKGQLKVAQPSLSIWYAIFTWSFYGAAILTIFFFMLRIVRTKDPVVAEPLHFTVVQSAVHRTDHGMQAHTFLLNQQTGEMWQMVCDQKGTVVGFRRVRRLGVDGNPEPDHNALPDTAKKP